MRHFALVPSGYRSIRFIFTIYYISYFDYYTLLTFYTFIWLYFCWTHLLSPLCFVFMLACLIVSLIFCLSTNNAQIDFNNFCPLLPIVCVILPRFPPFPVFTPLSTAHHFDRFVRQVNKQGRKYHTSAHRVNGGKLHYCFCACLEPCVGWYASYTFANVFRLPSAHYLPAVRPMIDESLLYVPCVSVGLFLLLFTYLITKVDIDVYINSGKWIFMNLLATNRIAKVESQLLVFFFLKLCLLLKK